MDRDLIRVGTPIIGIVGARAVDNQEAYNKVFDKLKEVWIKDAIICSGGADSGGDSFAFSIHKEYKIPYIEFPANGKKAGFLRNSTIAEWSDILIAVVREDSTYKTGDHKGGTEDTIRKWIEHKNGDRINLHII